MQDYIIVCHSSFSCEGDGCGDGMDRRLSLFINSDTISSASRKESHSFRTVGPPQPSKQDLSYISHGCHGDCGKWLWREGFRSGAVAPVGIDIVVFAQRSPESDWIVIKNDISFYIFLLCTRKSSAVRWHRSSIIVQTWMFKLLFLFPFFSG